MPRIQQFQARRGTAAAWTSANPILADGEQGLETDTGYIKFGDGSTAWNSLPYQQPYRANTPRYFPRTAKNLWDPRTASYNLTDNQHPIRADLKKIQHGDQDFHILFAGDSTLVGYNGSTYDYDQSIPRTMARSLSHLLNDIPYTGGVQLPIGNFGNYLNNVTGSGTWTAYYNLAFSNGAGSLIWTSLDAGTSVQFVYSNRSTSGFTYKIDGGSAVAVTTNNTDTLGQVTVSGLTNTTHTIEIVSLAGQTIYIFGFRIWNPSFKQIHLHNLGVGGSKANGGTINGQNWSSTQATSPVGLGWSGPATITAAGITPDLLVISVGNNDVYSSISAGNAATGIQNIRNYWSGVPVLFVHPPMVTGTTQSLFDALCTQFFALADTNNGMFFDWNYWDGEITGYSADGLAGTDGIHPTFAEQWGVGRHLALLLSQADYMGPQDPIVAPFSSSGALTVKTGTFTWYNDSGRSLRIQSIRASVGTAPTGAAIILDVNKGGTTIYTTQGNRPTIAAGTKTVKNTSMNTVVVGDGDYLTVDIDQIGSTVAGSDLSVQITMV